MDETTEAGLQPEPIQTEVATAEKTRRGRPKGSRNKPKPKAPKSLAPDLGELGTPVEDAREQFFWVGLFPECPESAIHLAGITFQKVTERLYSVDGHTMKKRQPQVGGIAKITREQMERLAERVPRTVIRFFDTPPQLRDSEEEIVEVLTNRGPVRGHCLTVPTDEERALARSQKRPTRAYRAAENDRNVAHYIYCVPCENQKSPRVGSDYPAPVSETGLDWPGSD